VKHVPAWFPGAGFQQYAEQARVDHVRLRDRPIEVVMTEMVSRHGLVYVPSSCTNLDGKAEGTASTSMARAMLEADAALPAEQSQLQLIKDLTALVYIAGSDTTVAAVVSFFLAMLVYPEVQAKAQAEIDQVIGSDRLPEPEDADRLPYVHAVTSECLRWLPVTPLGQWPHLHIPGFPLNLMR
jgi:hypothetical protein